MNHPVLHEFKKVGETMAATFFLNPDGDTIIVRYKESTDLTEEMAVEILKAILPFKEAGAIVGITDATANYLNISPEARKYYKENIRIERTKANAIIVNSLPTKLLADFFTKVDKPEVPTMVFNDFKKAILWLGKFK